METENSADRPEYPSLAEAEAALREVDAAKAAVTTLPLPWWYFPALSLLLAPVPFVTMAPEPPWGVVIVIAGIAGWSALFGVLVGVTVRRIGVVPRPSRRPTTTFLIVGGLCALGTIVAYTAFDVAWAPTAFVEAVATGLMVVGIWYVVTRRGRGQA